MASFTKDRLLLSQDFTRDGIFTKTTATPPKRFQILGERSSGTNFVKRLLGRNTTLTPSEELGWKHGFPSTLAIPSDLAVICVVRRADDWALSMHRKPWHTVPALQELGFSSFIQSPWHTIIDRARYFGGPESAELIGQTLQMDRDPITGAAFDNIFCLRTAKLRGLLSYLNRECSCVFLRLEDMQAEPEKTLDAMTHSLRLPSRHTPFQPVHKRLGSKFKPAVENRPETPPSLSEVDRKFLCQTVDSALETLLGYGYEI